MKIKKVVNLCKSSGYMYLYDGEVQMLGDNNSLYFLDDCPEFSPATLCRAHDISDKQANKIVFRFESCPPSNISVADVVPEETRCEPISIGIAIRSKRYTAYRASQGIAFIDEKYLEPFFSDSDNFDVYERISESGAIYFAVKIGMFLKAIVFPTAKIINKTFLAELDELHSLCEVSFDNAERARTKIASGQMQMEDV